MPALPSTDVLLALIIGLVVPFRFAMERLRGFGKYAFAKLPQYDEEGDPHSHEQHSEQKNQ